MRKPLMHTKVTVKLRKSDYNDEKWYLVVESYPVRKPGSNKPGRIIEAVNRSITTPLWDYSSVTKVDEYGNFCYKPKRDANGVIQCTDNGTLAFSKIGNKTYYRPEDVERIIRIVEDRRKEAKWRGRTI